MAEERDSVRNQDLVRNTIFKLMLENDDTRFWTASSDST